MPKRAFFCLYNLTLLIVSLDQNPPLIWSHDEGLNYSFSKVFFPQLLVIIKWEWTASLGESWTSSSFAAIWKKERNHIGCSFASNKTTSISSKKFRRPWHISILHEKGKKLKNTKVFLLQNWFLLLLILMQFYLGQLKRYRKSSKVHF